MARLTLVHFPLSFDTLKRLVNIVSFSKEKKLLYHYIGLNIEDFVENSKTPFIWGNGSRVYRSSMMDLYYTTKERNQTKIGWLWAWGKGIRIFFADIINERPHIENKVIFNQNCSFNY